MSLSDIEDCGLTELKWKYKWLCEKKNEENKQLEKTLNGN